MNLLGLGKAVLFFSAFVAHAHAQIAVSAADGKQLRPNDTIDHMTPDEIAVIDLNAYPPKLLATLQAPASMIGPPSAVAVARDESFALVTASQMVDPADPAKLVPADVVTVVDLKNPKKPRMLQTVHAGPGASGVAINRDGTLALVASGGDEAVSVFAIKDRRLSPAGRIEFPEGSRPMDVAFMPDGRKALVVRRGDHRISVLAVEGQSVSLTEEEVTPGRGPYSVAISPDGKYGYTNNLGGAATRAEIDAAVEGEDGGDGPRTPGSVSVIDLNAMTVVASIEAGRTPETVALSPDGETLAVVVANGASVQARAPEYDSVFGLLRIYKAQDGALEPIAVIENGHWCQGATFSKDGGVLLVQCGSERNIEVYRIDGRNVVRDDAATLSLGSRGGSIATAFSR